MSKGIIGKKHSEDWKRNHSKCNNKNIVAHHINNFADFPELRFSVDNGIVLCRKCHLNIHRMPKVA